MSAKNSRAAQLKTSTSVSAITTDNDKMNFPQPVSTPLLKSYIRPCWLCMLLVKKLLCCPVSPYIHNNLGKQGILKATVLIKPIARSFTLWLTSWPLYSLWLELLVCSWQLRNLLYPSNQDWLAIDITINAIKHLSMWSLRTFVICQTVWVWQLYALFASSRIIALLYVVGT